jgi:hypothetical protein
LRNFGRFSRTSRMELTPWSLFAKRKRRLLGLAIHICASLIVPSRVSGAIPTLEARPKRYFRTLYA